MLKYVAVAVVAPLAVILGADPATNPLNIWDIIRDIGLAGIFFWIWQKERQERREAQALQIEEQRQHQKDLDAVRKEQLELVERMAPLFKSAVDTLDKVQQGMLHAVEHVSGAPTRSELDAELRKATKVVGDLQALLDSIKTHQGQAGAKQ